MANVLILKKNFDIINKLSISPTLYHLVSTEKDKIEHIIEMRGDSLYLDDNLYCSKIKRIKILNDGDFNEITFLKKYEQKTKRLSNIFYSKENLYKLISRRINIKKLKL